MGGGDVGAPFKKKGPIMVPIYRNSGLPYDGSITVTFYLYPSRMLARPLSRKSPPPSPPPSTLSRPNPGINLLGTPFLDLICILFHVRSELAMTSAFPPGDAVHVPLPAHQDIIIQTTVSLKKKIFFSTSTCYDVSAKFKQVKNHNQCRVPTTIQ